MTDDIVKRLERVAEEMNRRISTVHNRLDCPRCRAPRFERCRAMPRGYHGMDPSGRELAHSHRERWTQETPAR
jgi:hypothetical protein